MSMIPLDDGVARRLVDEQFPAWRELPLHQVLPGGWDNRTFRLGEELLVRLPSAEGYVEAVAKEQRWLPLIAPSVPFEVPEPVALGAPTAEFPRPWSIYRWIDGEPSTVADVADLERFAMDVAAFLKALAEVDPAEGPRPGTHNMWRGASPAVYDDDARRSLEVLEGVIDTSRARRVWDAALAAPITAPSVWFHGDIAPGNLLLRDGRLAAVIDFGTSGVGDPACDLAIAWTMFDRPARLAFRSALPADEGLWDRGRGWALWKAMLLLEGSAGSHDPAGEAERARQVIERVLDDESWAA